MQNELSKRIVTANTSQGIFGNSDYFYSCVGVATFCQSQVFRNELDRCVFSSARSLCLKSLAERQIAESTIVFKFGSQKVAKIALERLVQEQLIHQVIAHFAGRSQSSHWKREPPLVRRIAESWLLN